MRRLLIYGFFFFTILSSCKEKKGVCGVAVSESPRPRPKHTIAILPFKGTDSNLVNELKTGLEKKLLVEITILKELPLPNSAFYIPRRRYIADSLLSFLRRNKNRQYEKIAGITTNDISTHKGTYNNWGVMGLGYCPGEACIISSYRVMRTVKDREDLIKKMMVLSLHELGHTYSLPHCPDSLCIMRDAEGKMDLDRNVDYCNKCSRFLQSAGILK